MKKVVIIGGGASGLTAAINAKNDNNEIIILEQNNICGKKLLATGSGRCNYWNTDQDISHYHSYNTNLLEKFINEDIKKSAINFIDNIGVIPKIKNGYYYPASNQATSVASSLLTEAKIKNIIIKTNKEVQKITKKNNKFEIICQDEIINCDFLVAAMGTCASINKPYNGYELLKKLGHKIIEPLPSLVGLKAKGNYFKLWSGVRQDATIYLREDNKIIHKEKGEVQFTDYGLSGICVFNMSGRISRGLSQNKKEEIIINFYPEITISFRTWLEERNNKLKGRTILQLLEGTLNYKLIKTILKITNIKEELSWDILSSTQKIDLIKNLTNFSLLITSTNSNVKAQVMTGGISLSEINTETMESLICPNLYITGEILDVDGDCGGYNLGFAWMSGIKAGKSIREKTDD